MSEPPTGAGGYPPQPPGGTVYGSPYGGQPAPQQYGSAQPEPPQYGAPQPDPTLPQPTAPVPGQYAPGAAPVPPPGGPGSAPGYPQPMSAPPTSVPPVSGAGSAPGYPQPMSAPPTSVPPAYPMSAPPVSAPGYPMSAPPGPVPPYGAPAASGGKGRAALILGIVAGLLLVLGGVMTGLYVTTNGKLHKAEQQVSQRDGTITANRQEIDKLKGDLQTVRDKLADTQQDLTGTKNDRDEQARQKKVIASCLDKLTTAIAAASRGDKAAFDAANKGLDKVCDEAENYL
ncbi:hypothetical protein GCM10010169_10780 [Micromonospora fulviviridis]|uniref:hypothetical protein n=1 Tax=Micromonospora fulviviridis TaxID=47860 RepID=UPI00166B9120|nr:hypothetical protein [Micromonospora fulviviridis]GGR69169.1 hypothetical protein GCM10010169_10780 [Micromonospora fulviviridis]